MELLRKWDCNVPTLRFSNKTIWEKKRIKDFCEVNPKTEELEDEFIYIDLESVSKGCLLSKNIISKTNAPSRAQRVLTNNDILFQCVRPYQMNNLLFNAENADFQYVASTGYAQIRTQENPSFVYHLLHSPNFNKEVMLRCTGSSYPAITSSDLGDIEVYICGVGEQQKIGHFLDLIDRRIAVQNKIIEDLKVLKKELCNDHFKSVLRDTSLQYIALKEILTERKEYCSKDGTYTHGTLSKEGVAPKTERYDRDFLVKNEDKQYKVTHLNDICYNPANLKFGVICRNTYGDLIFSPIYVTFEISDNVCPAYIELFLTNSNFIGRIRRYEQGTVYERMAVSPEDFLSYETHMPTYEEQVKFANEMQCIQRKIELKTAFLSSLQRQRKYLLTAMFI